MCMPKAPNYVQATARPSNHSLPDKFNVTILEIKIGTFVAEFELVEQITEWDTMLITVNWYSYIGNGMVYQNLILWFPDAEDRTSMNSGGASKYCTDNGGRLVDIVDKAMYDVVYNYCRQTIVFGSHGKATIWLGLTYDVTTDMVTQSNGKPGYHGDWYPDSPEKRASSFTRLGLDIRPPSSTSRIHGMYNQPPSTSRTVTQLCSANLM
ncbi:uncharacterized protein LOC144744815 [Ciona intestinalis]